jgi:Protein of unknown function (DUF998)
MVRKILLSCGIVASVLSVATDIVATLRYAGYSFISRSASELSAIGAPTRPLVAPLNVASDVLMMAFGLGVWLLAGRKRAPRFTGGLIVGNAVMSLVVSAFFPMHLSEAVGTFRNTMNVILAAVSVIFFLLAIGFGAAAYRRWFRFYSIGTLLTFLVLGIVGLTRAPQTPAGERVSLVGVQERTMIYCYLLWVAVLAIRLLRTQGSAALRHEETPTMIPQDVAR